MTTFTKWFLINAATITATFFAESKGMVSLMIRSDSSYITILIMLLYVGLAAFVGDLCYKADQINDNKLSSSDEKSILLKKADVGWFMAEHFFSLGLLGTIIGLCIATSTSLSGTQVQITEVVSSLKVGLNTAFYTTICGIVYSLPLQAQLMILKYRLEK